MPKMDTAFVLSLDETVTIVRPMPSVVPRGVHSSRERQPTRSLRLNSEVLEAIDEVSGLLGMSRSSFMSWCSYQVALSILRKRKEYMGRTT